MSAKESRLVAREQEQFVIGALLMNNDAIDGIGDLRGEHFFNADHRKIFETIVKIVTAGKGADVITVFDALQAAGSSAADLSYLTDLQQNTASSVNIRQYSGIVRDRAIKRGIISLCRETEESIEKSIEDAPALVDRLSSKLEELARAHVRNEPVLAADDMLAHITSIDERYRGAEIAAISTGYPDIDKRLNGGLRRGNLIVVAGRPKMGKTGLAVNIANHVAVDGISAVFSMEMGRSELHDRNLSSIGKIHLDHLIDPRQLSDEDWPGVTYAVQKISKMRLYIDDQPALTLLDVRSKAKIIKRKAGLDVLVIDYLQLMSGEGTNRNAQIEGITRGLKALAKELDIAILLLSQLNRKLEERPNKRPMPSDLRDSGSIEQDCDIAIFLYRDEVYNPDTQDKGVCEVNIALNRQGAPGIVALAYIGEQVRFESMAHQWHPAPPKKQAPKSRGFNDD